MKESRPRRAQRPLPAPEFGRLPLGAKTSSYVLAELCYQREDFKKAVQIARKRVDRDRTDFRSLNLMGACLGQMGIFDEAEKLLDRVSKMPKSCGLKHKARFNLGLVQLCRDLTDWGDCSTAATLQAAPSMRSVANLERLTLPFQTALNTWKPLLAIKSPYAHIFQTYFAFANLQFGNLDAALTAMMNCFDVSENFYASHFVLGKILMDLYQLHLDGQVFFLSPEAIKFLEIDTSELIERRNERGVVCQETLLELALQAFLESRELNPFSASVALGLCHVFLVADLPEEAKDHLDFAENLAGDALPVLDTLLAFIERYDPGEESIKSVVKRIQRLRKGARTPDIRFIIPQHFLV